MVILSLIGTNSLRPRGRRSDAMSEATNSSSTWKEESFSLERR
ncbi:MAG: hypothetical protein WC453_04485 [Patescibacteria group bacterium]